MQVETTGGHIAEVDADAIPKEKKAETASQPFQCSKCPFGCKNIGDMTMHKKHKHPEPTKAAGAGSAMAKFVANARLGADITVTWLVRDIVKRCFRRHRL